MRINWRLASRLSVITLAILVVVIVTVIQRNNSDASQNSTKNTSGFQGTALEGKPAQNFQLTDQYGKKVSLAGLKGKPVIITFLFTRCPDVCPLTAEKLHAALEKLGPQAQDVEILAVSTDPRNDTVAAALKFSQVHRMENSWHFLVGTQTELASVWKNYSMYVQAQKDTSVTHTLGVYMLDKQGHERVYLNDNFTSDDIATNVKILAKE